MKILVICDRDWTHPQGGGAGMNLRHQIGFWRAWGHTVEIFTVAHPGAPRHHREPDLTIHRRGSTHTVYFWAAAALLRGLGSDADVILEVVNGVPWMSKFLARKPTVVMIHHVCQQQYDLEYPPPISTLGKLLEARLMPAAYRTLQFLTVSETSKRRLWELGVPKEHIAVVHNGVDHAIRPPFDEYHRAALRGDLSFKSVAPTLVYLGRLKKYKRVDELLRLVAPLLEVRPEARFYLIGDGDRRQELESLALSLGVGEQVVFFGHVDEDQKMRLLSEAWLAVTASNVEGWSISSMEAAVVGCPTVALSDSGVGEAVIDGETGYVCADPCRFWRTCSAVLDHRDLRERLAAKGAERAASFTWEEAARRTLEVLIRTLSTEPHSGDEKRTIP